MGVSNLGLRQRWGVVKTIERRGELKLNAVVTSLCWPSEWSVLEDFRAMVQEGERLYWTVAVHPRVKFEEGDKIRWGDMLKDGRCVGVGEVGLDRKGNASQARSLDLGARLAVQHNKALVVQCRGGGYLHEWARGTIKNAGGEQFEGLCTFFTGGGGGYV